MNTYNEKTEVNTYRIQELNASLVIPEILEHLTKEDIPLKEIKQLDSHDFIRGRKKEICFLFSIYEQIKKFDPVIFEFGSAFNHFTHQGLYSGEISHFFSMQETIPYFAFEPEMKSGFFQRLRLSNYSRKHHINKKFIEKVRSHHFKSFEEIKNKVDEIISNNQLPIYFSNNILFPDFNSDANFLQLKKGLHIHSFYLDDILFMLREKIKSENKGLTEMEKEDLLLDKFPYIDKNKSSLAKSLDYLFDLEKPRININFYQDRYLGKAIALWYKS